MTRHDLAAHITAFAMFLLAWGYAGGEPATAIILITAALAVEGTVNA